ncbi:MAG: KEOPS complex kinase/ATPase Bud32 [Candidatus Hydrothermarchaeota archaeon]
MDEAVKRIGKGAEADIYLEGDVVVKERVKKAYRVAELDEALRRTRTRREARLLSLARRAGVATPFVYDVDTKGTTLRMGYLDGRPLRDVLETLPPEERLSVCRWVGEAVGLMHAAHLIHGDLTTSNMILKEGRIYFIDFGLGEVSEAVEAKGVDLLVFRRALRSTHHRLEEECFGAFQEGYAFRYGGHEEVLERLRLIERRGRYFTGRA